MVMAFIAEPVVGATAGAVPAVAGYFKRIREICDQYGVLLVLDEVMCGMGRTGTLYACEQEEIAPDLLTCAKGLGAGYQPIGATLLSQKISNAIRDGTGFFQHGHTYMGHPVACAAALAVQNIIQEEELLVRVIEMGGQLKEALISRFGNNQNIGDIRGRGLLQAMEFVVDRATKKPFNPAAKLHSIIKKEAMERGLISYPMGGTVDGELGDHVLLAPPFIIEGTHIEELVEKLGDSIDSALESILIR